MVQGYAELDRTQIGADVAAGFGVAGNQESPHLLGESLELVRLQILEVLGRFDGGRCQHDGCPFFS